MKVKHLVISGGGINGFVNYAILRDSHKDGYWSVEDLKTIYGTSSGSIVGLVICLKYDWDSLDNYFIKRPWNNLFCVDVNIMLSALNKRGIFEYKHIEQMFSPLFLGKDINLDITLEEFYKWSGIEIHIFATEINQGLSRDVDFSYKTHPHWKVLEAVYCSCCLPILFQPFLKESECFMDGGGFLNYPLLPCIENVGESEIQYIWGIKRCALNHIGPQHVNEETSLWDTIIILMNKMIERANIVSPDTFSHTQLKEIKVSCSTISFSEIFRIFENQTEREKLFEIGSQTWQDYKNQQSMNKVCPIDMNK